MPPRRRLERTSRASIGLSTKAIAISHFLAPGETRMTRPVNGRDSELRQSVNAFSLATGSGASTSFGSTRFP
jgi:hypothetical protein